MRSVLFIGFLIAGTTLILSTGLVWATGYGMWSLVIEVTLAAMIAALPARIVSDLICG